MPYTILVACPQCWGLPKKIDVIQDGDDTFYTMDCVPCHLRWSEYITPYVDENAVGILTRQYVERLDSVVDRDEDQVRGG